jgi:hypothetical protein
MSTIQKGVIRVKDVKAGNIGKDKVIILDPLDVPEEAPIHEPSPAPVPVREPVPA